MYGNRTAGRETQLAQPVCAENRAEYTNLVLVLCIWRTHAYRMTTNTTWVDLTDELTSELFEAVERGKWFRDRIGDPQRFGGVSIYTISRQFSDGHCEQRFELVALDSVAMIPAQLRELITRLTGIADKA
jgi:hypothetical protein